VGTPSFRETLLGPRGGGSNGTTPGPTDPRGGLAPGVGGAHTLPAPTATMNDIMRGGISRGEPVPVYGDPQQPTTRDPMENPVTVTPYDTNQTMNDLLRRR
jgi:hypothetical protein